jgi:hypothetical protein
MKRYNPPKEKRHKNMKPKKLVCFIAVLTGGLLQPAFAAPSAWDQPASALAARIADILGPGQAQLTLQNLSSIPADQIPAIRNLLSQDLKVHGIALTGADSANVVRVTLTESARERLWVAEIAEGDQTKVAMVELGPAPADTARPTGALVLRRQTILTAREPVLAAMEMGAGLVALKPRQIVFYTRVADGWQEQQRTNLDAQPLLARDPRGMLQPGPSGVEAWLPGVHCAVNAVPATPPSTCQASDDPWTVENAVGNAPAIRAFYNPARNYFTGVLVPDPGLALPPFYALAVLPRPAGTALLLGGIDGKVQIVENGALHSVAGTRDWGSDFAVLQSGCGTGTQVVVSGSGDAANDSLRAYELPASEALPVSEPLDIQGTVTALSTAPDNRSVVAIVRNAQNQYEVDRVSALCN